MTFEEIVKQLKALLENPTIRLEQKKAIEQVLKDYRPGLSNDQLIKIIEIIITILFMK